MNAIVALKKAKDYTNDTVIGLGAVKGSPCTIKSTTETPDGTEVVFEWTGTSGTKETTSLNVKNGTSITKVTVDNNNNLIIDFSDGTSITAGNIKTIKGDKGDTGDTGKDGFSPTVTITNATAMHTVSITDATGVQSFVVKDGTPVDMQDYYTKTEINNQLNLKADKTSIPVVPTNLSAFANDVNFINNTVDNLVNYYKKTETYTQSEINTLISNINKLTTEIVQSLPTSSISTTTIYLVPVSGKQDVYSQYMYINSAWALLGETTIDLTNFYTKTEVDNKLSSKADISSIPVVPTNVSQFNNDAGYITGYTETDPTVPAWAKQATKPTYTAQEVGALPDNTVIPVFTNKTVLDKITVTDVDNWNEANVKSHEHTNKNVLDKFSDINGTVLYDGSVISGGSEIDDTTTTEIDKTWSAKKIYDSIVDVDNKIINYYNDLSNNKANQSDLSSHENNADIHVTAAEKSVWDAKADTSDIPTKISELTNDSGFITSADGGNADKLDGLHAVDFSQIVDFGSTSTDTKTAVGIEGKCTVYRCSSWTDYPAALTNGQGHIIAINYKGTGTAGSDSMWVRQIYISANTSITDPRLYQRYISASNVSDWIDIADGGNAATVGGRSITVTDVDPGAGSALGTGEIVFVTEVT